jgi:hypothetical protein
VKERFVKERFVSGHRFSDADDGAKNETASAAALAEPQRLKPIDEPRSYGTPAGVP